MLESKTENSKAEHLINSFTFKLTKIFSAAVWYLSWFASGLLVIGLIAFLFGFDPDNLHVQAPVTLEYHGSDSDHEWIPFNERPQIIYVKGEAQVNVAPIGRADLMGRFGCAGLFLLMFLWAAYQLRLVIKSIKSGAPFDQQNPKRLQWIGWMILAMGPFLGIFSYWQGTTMIDKLSLPGARINLDLDIHLSLILLGIVILVISQIFDIAVKLQQDQELTI